MVTRDKTGSGYKTDGNKMVYKEEKRSSLRRLFSIKKRDSQKRKVLNEVLENQKLIWDKVSAIPGGEPEGIDHNRCMEHLKETEKEMREKLEHYYKYEKKMDAEIKQLTNEKHRLELDLVREKMDNKQLANETSRLIQELKLATDSIKDFKSEMRDLEKQKSAMKEECGKHIDRTRQLERCLDGLTISKQRLEEQIENKNEAVDKLEKDRGKLLMYMKKRSSQYEEQLAVMTDQFRRKLARLYKDSRNSSHSMVPLAIAPDTNEGMVTKLMEADFKVYRRDRLIDVLVDRLRQYEPDFDVLTASECSAFLDKDCRITPIGDFTRDYGDLLTSVSETSSMA